MSIYTENGYENRRDYLLCLTDDYGIDIATVTAMASILGPSEDFDALVTEIQDESERRAKDAAYD